MEHVRPLPDFLLAGHRRWRGEMAPEVRARLNRLAREGQAPPAMIIACCDSRVLVSEVFGSDAGEIFVHRNIAALVPPYTPDGGQHGTSATIQFAVESLKVRHLVVMGHYACGGVAGCLHHAQHSGDAPVPKEDFLRGWLEILKPRVEGVVARGLGAEATLRALEREAVLLSLDNLMTFPFVRAAVEEGRLELHGLWKKIRDGVLEYYDAERGWFVPI